MPNHVHIALRSLGDEDLAPTEHTRSKSATEPEGFAILGKSRKQSSESWTVRQRAGPALVERREKRGLKPRNAA